MNNHIHPHHLNRRDFLARSTQLATVGILGSALAETAAPAKSPSETLVTQLYKSLNDDQKKLIAFPWSHPLRQDSTSTGEITPPNSVLLSGLQSTERLKTFRGSGASLRRMRSTCSTVSTHMRR